MKRKIILFFIVGTTLAVSLLAFEVVNAKRTGSGTTKISIDGRSFIVENPSLNGKSALRQELARLGIPEGIVNLDETRSFKPVVPEKSKATRKMNLEKAPGIPEALKAEHTLRMSGEDGSVELVMGTIKRGTGLAVVQLEADKWIQTEMAGSRDLPKIFRKNRGKETDIVCLDEKKGIFLLLRKLER